MTTRPIIIADIYSSCRTAWTDRSSESSSSGVQVDDLTWISGYLSKDAADAHLERVFELLESEDLRADFWEPYITVEACGVGTTFAGNFERVSHSFSVTTLDSALAARFRAAIERNLARSAEVKEAKRRRLIRPVATGGYELGAPRRKVKTGAPQ